MPAFAATRANPAACVGELSHGLQPLEGHVPAGRAERVFADHADRNSLLVARRDGGLCILDRRRFANQMAGRLGYGRSLHHRKPVERLLAGVDTLTLPAATTLDDAGAAVLARPADTRYDDMVVAFPDGKAAVLTVSNLFQALAGAHAHRALHDELTGLANRALFFDALTQARAEGQRVAVLFLDLDDFKGVNDSLGHEAGDQLLGTLADRLAAATDSRDLVARLGGDEFGVLLCGHDPLATTALAERLGAMISSPVDLGRTAVTVTASIGIAFDRPGASADTLVRHADLAMYRAKTSADRSVCVFEARAHAGELTRIEIESELRGAVGRGELSLAFQPIVDLGSGTIVACEALLRWTHPEFGNVAPASFIPIAEKTGEILPIGAWVVDQACAAAARWPTVRSDGQPLMVGVNASVHQAADPGFPTLVTTALERHEVEADRLVVEITESALVKEGSTAIQTLNELTRIGVRVVLDDFGTGYSSLAHLQRLPLDSVKIDRAFVGALGGSDADSAIVRAILGMADALGLHVVAEGVETQDQARILTELGCQRAQGYLFSRPVSESALSALLASQAALPV